MVTWHAVDGNGLDPGTGRPPQGQGAASPAGALAAVPVGTWPLRVVGTDGRRVGVAEALGNGGTRVAELLERLATAAVPPSRPALEACARATPAGPIDLPVVVVGLGEGTAASAAVDRRWMACVEERRAAARPVLQRAGRVSELEAALNVAMLLATERVEGEGDVQARTASGARLWLLGGAVAWALAGGGDPFAPWADLVSYGLWPVGPVANGSDRLVVCDPTR